MCVCVRQAREALKVLGPQLDAMCEDIVDLQKQLKFIYDALTQGLGFEA